MSIYLQNPKKKHFGFTLIYLTVLIITTCVYLKTSNWVAGIILLCMLCFYFLGVLIIVLKTLTNQPTK